MTFNDLVQKKMFLLMVFIFVLSEFLVGVHDIGINKTIGWAWDFTNWLLFAKSYLAPLYIIGYAVLALLQRLTHKNLSKAHLILAIVTFSTDHVLLMNLTPILILNLASFMAFTFNLIWSIQNKKGL